MLQVFALIQSTENKVSKELTLDDVFVKEPLKIPLPLVYDRALVTEKFPDFLCLVTSLSLLVGLICGQFRLVIFLTLPRKR